MSGRLDLSDLCSTAALIEERLAALLPSEESMPQALHRAMRYAVLGGGKRLRPRLLFGVAAASAPTALCEDEVELVTRAACALEFIHCASLVHDDLPCFDDAPERRGRPSVHAHFGEPLAVLTGDALLCLAFEVLASTPTSRPGRLLRITRALCAATGSREGLIGGQGLEQPASAASPQEQAGLIECYHAMKTAALFRAAAAAAAYAVNAPAAEKWGEVGCTIGLAFQLADDLYDTTGRPAEGGKSVGCDARTGAPNAARARGLSWARAEVAALLRLAFEQTHQLTQRDGVAQSLLAPVTAALAGAAGLADLAREINAALLPLQAAG